MKASVTMILKRHFRELLKKDVPGVNGLSASDFILEVRWHHDDTSLKVFLRTFYFKAGEAFENRFTSSKFRSL